MLEAIALTGATAIVSAAFLLRLHREIMHEVGVTILDGGVKALRLTRTVTVYDAPRYVAVGRGTHVPVGGGTRRVQETVVSALLHKKTVHFVRLLDAANTWKYLNTASRVISTLRKYQVRDDSVAIYPPMAAYEYVYDRETPVFMRDGCATDDKSRLADHLAGQHPVWYIWAVSLTVLALLLFGLYNAEHEQRRFHDMMRSLIPFYSK